MCTRLNSTISLGNHGCVAVASFVGERPTLVFRELVMRSLSSTVVVFVGVVYVVLVFGKKRM